MDINLFVNITSKAWTMPILSSLHSGVPGRQATLLTATGASRTAFVQSINHLIEIKLLERNPGYGHPLRPEYRLTELGTVAAAIADKVQKVSSEEDQTLMRRSWTLPVLTTIHKPTSFNEIKRRLNKITDRALSQSLKSMEMKNWVCREIEQDIRPPRSMYSAVRFGHELSTITAAEITFS